MLFPLQPYTRHRSQVVDLDTLSYAYNQITWGGNPGNPWAVTSNNNYSGSFHSRLSEEMFDVESPNWLKLWTKGIATVNPMEHCQTFYYRGVSDYLVKRVNRDGTAPNYYYTGSQSSGTNTIGDTESSSAWTYPSQPSIDDSIIAEAILNCWSKVSLSDTLVLAQAAELGKTLTFLISTFRRALKIIHDVKTLDLKGLWGELKPSELRQRYLEARYAIRPMMFDIRNTLKAFSNQEAKYKTFRAFMTDLEETSGSIICRNVPGDYRIDGSYQATRSLEVRTGVLAYVESLQAFYRFGCGDILQTAWELVPFSFIVDWFFQIGKLISAWSPKLGLKTLASWCVVDDITHLTVAAETGTDLTSYNYIKIYSRTGSYQKVIRTRYRLPNPDRPFLPSYTIKLDGLKLLDLGAIAWQIYNAWSPPAPKWRRGRNNPGYGWFDDARIANKSRIY